MFGLGWMNDTAEAKVRGLQTAVAGSLAAGLANALF
jgi:hypothetical protein